VSNYSIDEIEELTVATGDIPEVNQIPWSPFLYDPAEEHELARRHIVLEGYSPLKKSQLDHPVLVDIAAAVGRTPAQVVLRWHVQHGVVVIPKSADPARIAENFDIFDFSLDTASMEQLDEIASP
jgi:diketogulonate reductase-like aldo/keto reductase